MNGVKITAFSKLFESMSRKSLMLVLIAFSLTACQSAFLTFPGSALQGVEAEAEDFAFAAGYRLLQLETNGDYSVILRVTVIEGDLYIDAAPTRRWAKHLATNPNVRIKLGNRVYRGFARRVEDLSITSQFMKRRQIFRIDPGIEPKHTSVGTYMLKKVA